MRSPTSIAIALLLLLPPAGCSGSSSVLRPDRGEPVAMFASGHDAMAAASKDPASIGGVSVVANQLFVEVSFSGGCAEHRFALHASEAFLESLPPQAILVLSHDADDDECETLLTETLVFDLDGLERAYRRAYRDGGPFQLRIFAPGSPDPVRPLPLFEL